MSDKLRLNQVYDICLITMFTLFMLYAFYSIGVTYKRLVRNSISSEARWGFFQKHAIYVLVLLFIWTIQLLHNYLEIFKNPSSESIQNEGITNLSYFFIFITGVALAVLRVFDKFFRHYVVSMVLEWFGKLNDQAQAPDASAPLSTILAKSLNLELINVILQSISLFANDQHIFTFEAEDYFAGNHKVRQQNLSRIVINNVNKLN